MDERQQQIKSGAGLEESRINEDFKEFLEKWGFWLLLLVAVGFGGLWAFQKLEERRVAKVDAAFAAYEGAAGSANPSPDALRRVADEYEGVRSISDLARLRSADIYLHSARTGLLPGAEYDAEGELTNEDDLLTDEQVARQLDQAQGLYALVYESAEASGSVLSIEAAFGMGAAGESKGDVELARRGYEAAKAAATRHGRPVLARAAGARLEAIADGVPERLALFSEDDLPELPTYTPPAPTPVETQIPVVDDEGLAAPLPEGDADAEDGAEPGDGEATSEGESEPAGEDADDDTGGDDAP